MQACVRLGRSGFSTTETSSSMPALDDLSIPMHDSRISDRDPHVMKTPEFSWAYLKPACVAILILCAHMSVLHAASGELLEADRKALVERKIIFRSTTNTKEELRGVRALFYVDASRKEIWETLVDYDNFPAIFGGIDKMEVLSQDAAGARVEFWGRFILKKLHFVLDRKYTKPEYDLSWTQVSGDLKDIQGSWRIRDTVDPETKLLIYHSYIDIGIPIPEIILEFGAERQTKKMARKLRDWLEG